ncbi:MAG: polymerase sigma factor [Paenibacillus sp.]|jgi:RNA polymerase sigma-70 factor (ECF subfamily)|nr:polymerase sigma factor [Paenibacillus sp.]
MTDEQLVEELKSGSGSAVESLIIRYHAPIFAYLYRMVHSKPLAEDLTQECFVKAMESIRRKRVPDRLRPWIYTIAANLCKDLWRKSSYRQEQLQDELNIENRYKLEDMVASIFERQADRERVVRALHQLEPDKRNLIVLRFYQELKLDEIAHILDIPLSTVKSRLYHCLGELHRLLKEEPSESQRSLKGVRT